VEMKNTRGTICLVDSSAFGQTLACGTRHLMKSQDSSEKYSFYLFLIQQDLNGTSISSHKANKILK